MKRLFYFALPFLAACGGLSPEKASEIITSQSIGSDIAVLASDSLQGRGPCTPSEAKTLSFLQLRMKELGLEPAFNGSYLQRVPLVKITTMPVGNMDFSLSKLFFKG